METHQQALEKLVNHMSAAKEVYVLTGAGMSTESGIPDFRSKNGLWQKVDPTKYSTREVLMGAPEKFFQYGFERFKMLMDKEPNPGHYALADLERNGIIKGVLTQNIDRLHQKAGSKQVFEVHGSTETCHCLGCHQEYPFNELIRQLDKEQKKVPKCTQCGGMLRPDIVLFGDPLPETFFNIATVLKQRCDFLLVVGTSLQVYPVAGLAELGIPLGIINYDATPFDSLAEVVIHGSCGETLTQLRDLLL